MYRRLFFTSLSLLLLLALTPSASAAPARYIVVVSDNASVPAVANRHGASVEHRYRHALKGFSAVLSNSRVRALRKDPAVRYVAADRPMTIAAKPDKPGKPGGGGGEEPPSDTTQTTPLGMLRSLLPSAYRNSSPDAVDVDVAVIDTGIADHADLNLVGGTNCSTGRRFADGHGHGTHVAGTIGARDNTVDVVGAAPGARLWAVRVLNNAGSGSTATVACGIDWVTANADIIDVANLSLGGVGSDDGNCGATSGDPMHEAICASVAAGVTYVVAAGNESDDAAGHTPAAYDEVITVSSIADSDGASGAHGGQTCIGSADDSFSSFSNYGTDVDIAAPGECILSTAASGGTTTMSGTSMAAPHVAGAAAAYIAMHPEATPEQVANAITTTAGEPAFPGDPDGIWEGLLNISALLA